MASNYPKNVYHPVLGFAHEVDSKEQEEAWTKQGWVLTAPEGVEPPAPVSSTGEAEATVRTDEAPAEKSKSKK